MSPFKEPQPRKKSIQEEHEAKQRGGVFPPYARLGNEARWQDTTDPEPPRVWEPEQAPIMVLPDHSPFELRKAALEAACAFHEDGDHNSLFWDNLQTFENYLRDGTKPS